MLLLSFNSYWYVPWELLNSVEQEQHSHQSIYVFSKSLRYVLMKAELRLILFDNTWSQ